MSYLIYAFVNIIVLHLLYLIRFLPTSVSPHLHIRKTSHKRTLSSRDTTSQSHTKVLTVKYCGEKELQQNEREAS